MVKAIFWDLDGTLLPMEEDTLLGADLSGIGVKLAAHGYAPQLMGKAFHDGTVAMIRNDGSKSNEEVFWQAFRDIFGESVIKDIPLITGVYHSEFSTLKDACGFDTRAAACVRQLRELGYRLILATNPLFPPAMTHMRLRWAGVEPGEFEFITTYDNSRFSKPNPEYYRDLLDILNLKAEECLMIGNDVTEDMIAETVGFHTFLLTDSLINRQKKDISAWPNGSYPELMQFIGAL